MEIRHRDLDGQNLIDDLAELVVRWEFVARGEWSQSPMHEGVAEYHLGYTSDGRIYVLRVDEVDQSDPPNAPGGQHVAAAVDARGEDPNDVVRELIESLWQFGGKCIESYDAVGEFDLD